jgi:serine/threonine protein kinase
MVRIVGEIARMHGDGEGASFALPAVSQLLADIARAAVARADDGQWQIEPGDAWCVVTPSEGVTRAHGWKLHLTATPLSAPLVLAAAAEVLISRRCSFKFAPDIRRVTELVSDWCDRGASGKFITVYPRDDDQFRELAVELDWATTGLVGPQILSDRQLRRGSLVYYRYGEFRGDAVFTDDGAFESRMVGPDGTESKDERRAWFCAPLWASTPFPAGGEVPEAAPRSPLLMDRFRVTGAIRHANKGGVFKATDELSGATVVIKQARAHVGARIDGTDVRDRLRREAQMLEVLAPLSIVPTKLALFKQQDDLFLAQEWIPGVSLHQWAVDRTILEHPDLADVVSVSRQLVGLIRVVHQAGYVIRDLKPQNVMISPVGILRLVDVEFVAESGRNYPPAVSVGYSAPEIAEAHGQRLMPVADPALDLFSLGATLFTVLTALQATWIGGPGETQESAALQRQVLHHISAARPLLAVFVDLILGLTDPSPTARWSLEQVDEFLVGLTQSAAEQVTVPIKSWSSTASLDRLLADGLVHLRREMRPLEPSLWRPLNGASRNDPLNAWSGAAGTLATLTRAAVIFDDTSLTNAVAGAAAWIDNRLHAVPRLLPGLAFGRSGTAWALFDAARLIGDEPMANRAMELVRQLPTQWHSPDVTHGLSGAGMSHLHLWLVDGDEDLWRRTLVYADRVLEAAHRSGDDWLWPTGTDTNSLLSGTNAYGFAHGVAGAGTFLLAVSQAIANGQAAEANRFSLYREAAIGAGHTLIRAARVSSRIARWPAAVGLEDLSTKHWCGGSAGIGMFLIRLWATTGLAQFAEFAELAAAAVTCDPWPESVGACCGLAGGGQFLLDMAEATGQSRYRDQAEQLAFVIYAQRRRHHGLELTCAPDHGIDYATGAAGVLDFLLRLRHGGPAPWIPRMELGPESRTPRAHRHAALSAR